MNFKLTLYMVGILNLFLALAMTAPLVVAHIYQDGTGDDFLISILLTVAASLLMILLCRKQSKGEVRHREGMAVVALGWFFAGLFGALPFYLAGTFPNYLDCLFEALSGFTTTGASVMTAIEGNPQGILFWRSLTHWLGGMGIIVLTIAILPFLGVGGMQLFKAEVPGPVADKLKPRITETAKLLWTVYMVFTAAEVLLLWLGGMTMFDSLCHTFGTLATGGFSTKNASIGHYNSVYFDIVITVFMLLSGINFALHYQALTGNLKTFYRNSEMRFFLGVFAVGTVLIAWSIWQGGLYGPGQSLRYASFQVASILTTTGYATADFELWPTLPQVVLLICIFIGGSTGFHRRQHQVHADHAPFQTQLPGAETADSSPGGHSPQAPGTGCAGRRAALGLGIFHPVHVPVCGRLPYPFGHGAGSGHFVYGRGGHHRQYRPGSGHGRSGGQLRPYTLRGQGRADFVHGAGPAGSLHRLYSFYSRILEKMSGAKEGLKSPA